MNKSLDALCRAIAGRLPALDSVPENLRPSFDHLRRSVEAAVARPITGRQSAHDYSQLLRSALRLDPQNPIVKAIAQLPAPLPWYYHYAPRPGESDLSSHICFAELIGPDGDMDAPDCRVGFTLMAPGILYPLHAHPAVELYFTLIGQGEWRAGDVVRTVPPGQLVLHRSNEVHSMQTFAEPLLALWSWSGDLDSPAFYI